MKILLQRLLIVSVCFGGLSMALHAKTNTLTVDFTVRSISNNHLGFIAAPNTSSPVTGYFWDYGDGSNSGWQTTDIANHTYAATGTYPVKLVIQNLAGETDSIIKNVNAYKNAIGTNADFSISPAVIYVGDTVRFLNTSTNTGGGSAAAYWWDFGTSGYASYVENPSFIFTQPGIQQITLTAGFDTAMKLIRILPRGLTANFFSPSTACKNYPLQFYDGSVSVPGNITSWQWQFGDGNTSSLQNPIHTYAGSAIYQVQLAVANDLGQSDTIIRNITITEPVTANFTYSPTIIFNGDSIRLADSSVGMCSPISNWEWECRGISPANNQFVWNGSGKKPPAFVLPDSGMYRITMRADSDTVIRTIKANLFTIRNVCAGDTFTLTAPQTGAPYRWQESTDNGINYSLIYNSNAFLGVGTHTLTIRRIPSSWNGRRYRCLVNNVPAIVYKIDITNQFIGSGNWETLSNWSCNSLPDQYTNVIISSGEVTINSDVVCNTLTVLPGASVVVSPGFNLTVLH